MKNHILKILFLALPFMGLSQTVTYNFETGDLSEWEQSPEDAWVISTKKPIAGSQSLNHFKTEDAGDARISISLPQWNASLGSYTWRFQLRHEFNPSGSNYWAVYLSSDKNAEGMLASEKPSGYVVGVNLTGYDDMLRLYRVDNGAFTPIITTDINWETMIGTDTVGAVEVVRSMDGEFSMAVDTLGSFDDLVAKGSVLDTSHDIEGYFGIYYKFTKKASGLLTVDDISMTYDLTYSNDADGQVLAPTEQAQGANINARNLNFEEPVEVLKFLVEDKGTADGVDTYITRMSFHSTDLSTNAPLNAMVKNAELWDANGKVETSSVDVREQSIVLNFPENEVVIDDGSSREFSLKVFFQEEGLQHASTMCVQIPAENHGFLSVSSGSGFATSFDADVVGPVFSFEVLAQYLAFDNQLNSVAIGQPAKVQVIAVDANGVFNPNVGGEVVLSLQEGTGGITVANAISTLENGIAQWDDVLFDKVGEYKLKANLKEDNSIISISKTIWCGAKIECPWNEGFENDYPEDFPATEEWEISTENPIQGVSSLKHIADSVGGVSTLPIPLKFQRLEGVVEWNITLRNGNWDPSSTNAFWFVLSSDNGSLTTGEYNGYAVGVNLLGTSDLLTLWSVSEADGVKPIVESKFDWDASDAVDIRVTRSPRGQWMLWYRVHGEDEMFQLAGQGDNNKFMECSSFGPVFKFTATRSGELWVDNLSVCITNYPPVIQEATLVGNSSVHVSFSTPVVAQDALKPQNYSIKNGSGKSYAVKGVGAIPNDPTKFVLRTEELPAGGLTLFAKGIASSTSDMLVDDSIIITRGAQGNFGSVIINEIMARPNSEMELPETQYIELFNRTSDTISLANWRLIAGTRILTISEGKLAPNGYAILSGVAGQPNMSAYGNAIGVTSFPSLLVGGMFLGLYDDVGNLVNWVEYSDKWYGDELKKLGGYSLERIDPDNLVEGGANWRASNHTAGGTPGSENSVKAVNPDNTSPRVVEVGVLNASTVYVVFSEFMDTLSIANPENYWLDRDNPVWISTQQPKYNRVEIILAQEMQAGREYHLCFSNDITDFSGNALSEECRSVGIPQTPQEKDIVINEILFNPYTGGVDFVELYNRSDKFFNLQQFRIANRHRETLEVNDVYAAADSAWLLPPSGYAVLTENPHLVSRFYYVEEPKNMVWVKKLPSYPNDNGHVVLLFGLNVIDEFAYDKDMHNRMISDAKGVSLERLNPELPTQSTDSWQSASQTAGFATPTARNSQFTDAIQAEDSFSLSHQVFSPDGDGFEDVLLINYDLSESDYLAEIIVFDSKGRRVKRLASNMLLGKSGSIQWDGTNDAGHRVGMGAYVVYIEVFDLTGKVKRFKKTVVVATKLR